MTQLARTIGLPLITLYGLGTIVGAGIYALIGKVAGTAGLAAPLAFVVAAMIAWCTAMTYARLVVRFPRSAGEALYVAYGLRSERLAKLVGLLVVFTGIVSSATLANAFVGYLRVFVPIPVPLGILAIIILFGGLAIWGIRESLWAAAIATVFSVIGLLLIIIVHADSLFVAVQQPATYFVPTSWSALVGIISGAFLAFYAFIGFEDMVNVVEEVKHPARTMPVAITLVMIIAVVLYIAIALVVVAVLPLEVLSASEAPLALLLENEFTFGAQLVSLIALFAVVNGILIQMIMCSRVLYGMAAAQQVWSLFAYVHPLTQTPLYATIVVIVAISIFALWLPLVSLAGMTSFVILTIFLLVNLSLWRLHKRDNASSFTQLLPVIGALLSAALLSSQVLILIVGW